MDKVTDLLLDASAAFRKQGLLVRMLSSSRVLIPPARAGPGRDRRNGCTGSAAVARAPGSRGNQPGKEGGGGRGSGREWGQEDAGASPSRAHAAGSKAGLPASSGWI